MRKSKSISFDEAITNLINGIAKEFNEKCTTLEDYKSGFNETINLLLALREIQLTARRDDKLRAEFKKLLLKLINTKEETSTDNTADIERKIADFQEKYPNKPSNAVIPSITPKRAESFIMPVTRAEQTLLFNTDKNLDFYTDGVDVKIASIGRGNKKEIITTFIALNFEDINPETVEISHIERLDDYTLAIYNAVISLIHAGNTLIPINSIYQVSTGYRKTNKTPEEKARQDIEDALRIARYTRVKIDATQEGQKLYPELESFIRESYLLPAEYKKAKINGQVVDCIEILKEPPLYEYARLKKQISSLDITLLDVPLSFTRDNVILKEYLLRQISIMKNEKAHRNYIILYETLYALLKAETKTEKKRIRDKTHTILDYWVSKGFIKGYEEISQGKNIAKIKIILDNPRKAIPAHTRRK